MKKALFRSAAAIILCIALCLTAVLPCFATESAVLNIAGNLNSDDSLSADDLVLMKKALLFDYTDAQYDVNGDEKVDILDYIRLKKLVARFVNAEKFAEKTIENTIYSDQIVTLGELFEIVGDYTVDSASVSLVFDTDTVAYTANTEDWTKSTVAFLTTGTVELTIYELCLPKTITFTVEKRPVDKFDIAKTFAVKENVETTLGTLFCETDNEEVNDAYVSVTVTGVAYNYVQNTDDWTQSTLTFTETGKATVTICDNDSETQELELTVSERTQNFETVFENTADYLYRVGNTNTVTLGSLFKAHLEDESEEITNGKVYVTVTAIEDGASVSGTYTANTTDWSAGTIKFSGTGPVKVEIYDVDSLTTTLYLEVVNATNVTAYSGLGNRNSVLLNDITMSSGSSYYLSGATLYGNGFTFDVTNGAYTAPGYDYASYVVGLSTANLDNVQIPGAVYPDFGATRNDDYNRAIVFASGDCTIANCYISNGASPIRSGGNVELINTTLKGGIYANIDHRNGQLILDNVTTINQIGDNDKYISSDGTETEIVGLGVVVYQEGGSENLSITIKNNLTQYNYLSEAQADTYITNSSAKLVTDKIFEFTDYLYNDGTTNWVNTGIISMNSYFSAEDLVDERTDKQNYFGTAETITLLGQSRDCYVYSAKPTSIVGATSYSSVGQHAILPSVEFDYTTKNYVAKTDGSNDYCYESDGVVYVSMDAGDSFSWDTSILTATKNGQTLSYTVSMNDTDYTGKSITLNTAGTYSVKYSYEDTLNYTMADDGSIETYSKTYEKTVIINVVVVEPDAKHAVFSFGTNGTEYSAKTETINETTYVMPNVTATVDGKIGSTTVNGTTVYYPITEMFTSDGKTTHTSTWYACFPIFKDALQIIDYADSGTGDAVTYNQTTVTTTAGIPSTLYAVDPTSAFLYQMNATNYPPPTDPTAVNSVVCYTCNRNGLSSTNGRVEMTIVAEYQYTDNAGMVYRYYIGYHCAEQTKNESCVTPDTLITLADGSQVRVDSLTGSEQLLVWNHTTGAFDTAPIAYIVNHNEEISEQEILHLYFSDGSDIKIISEHVFFDVDLNKYVALTSANADEYIGHTFVGISDDNTALTHITLDRIEREYRETALYEVVTYKNITCFTDGILSASAYLDKVLNIFDIEKDTFAYSPEKVQADIETYGLYTYEDFEELVPVEAFEMYNAAYLKIAVGKGYITWDDILDLIDIYFDVEVDPIQ